MLAIASLHLLRELSPSALEPSSARLLSAQDDPYITLNAVEAITASPASASGDLVKALLTRLSLAASREVIGSISAYLGDNVSLDIMESLRDMYASGDAPRKSAVLAIMGRRIASGLVGNREGTIEFLYKILRGNESPQRRCRRGAPVEAGGRLRPRGHEGLSFLRHRGGKSRNTSRPHGASPRAAPVRPGASPAAETPLIQEPLRELLLGAAEELRPECWTSPSACGAPPRGGSEWS